MQFEGFRRPPNAMAKNNAYSFLVAVGFITMRSMFCRKKGLVAPSHSQPPEVSGSKGQRSRRHMGKGVVRRQRRDWGAEGDRILASNLHTTRWHFPKRHFRHSENTPQQKRYSCLLCRRKLPSRPEFLLTISSDNPIKPKDTGCRFCFQPFRPLYYACLNSHHAT